MDPQTVTITGRLTFPTFGMTEAIARNTTSQYPKAADKIAPEFNLFLEQAQLDKLIRHLRDEFIPFAVERARHKETRNIVSDKHQKRLLDSLEEADWAEQPPFLPIKAIPVKSSELVPEAVAMLKVTGRAGQDIHQKAVVTGIDDLTHGTSQPVSYPAVMPIKNTVFSLYSGCRAAATLNLYAYVATGSPGISAQATTIVFKGDDTPFGGGVDIDEEELFLDD